MPQQSLLSHFPHDDSTKSSRTHSEWFLLTIFNLYLRQSKWRSEKDLTSCLANEKSYQRRVFSYNQLTTIESNQEKICSYEWTYIKQATARFQYLLRCHDHVTPACRVNCLILQLRDHRYVCQVRKTIHRTVQENRPLANASQSGTTIHVPICRTISKILPLSDSVVSL